MSWRCLKAWHRQKRLIATRRLKTSHRKKLAGLPAAVGAIATQAATVAMIAVVLSLQRGSASLPHI